MTAPTPPIRVSDPEIKNIASRLSGALQNRDPEASLDIAPPAEVLPPEERAEGSKDPYIGTTFDHRYKIQELLGEGGMGYVYLARHKVIDKKVAVKVLRADMARDREILERFLQEAKAASSIGNPHIIDISDFGDLPDGSTYFVMEYLEGQSLSQLMDAASEEKKLLTVERLAAIGMQMCDGLSAAHARGIIHRDLKPDNVFLIHRGSDQDFVKILDFGIAKVSNSASTKLTKAGAVFGTPHYMSPEQAAGSTIDHRTDIYAMGVILYEMASGQLPFNADNFMGILTQHMYKAPVPIRALVPAPDCPPSLEAVILKCLSKKPEQRYQSMDELATDLERVKEGGVPHAVAEMMARSGGFNVPADYFKQQPAVLVPATPVEPAKKGPRYVWIAGAVAAVGIVGAIFAISNVGMSNPKTSQSAAVSASAVPPPTTPASVSAAPEVKKTNVAIVATPESAKAYRGDQEIELPASIEVEEGKTVSIEIRADGYETQKIDLDGKDTSQRIKLKPLKGKPGPGGRPGPGVKPPKGKPGEIVNPWGK